MNKKHKIPLAVGDNVQIISGFYKDKTGEVLKIFSQTGKVIIKGINLKFKHIKPNQKGAVGEIKQMEAPIHHSNVKILKN
uniref:ribosomal protein L24 n=1 Tax=Tenuicylindrus belgicus TaxID=1398096 RepID=UPI002238ADB2|nr:ribosomal protein L24 [Tenuicylindrus belgicus]UYC31534.1 ribosomal protein L24 [Tenuicylindrus belgicus]